LCELVAQLEQVGRGQLLQARDHDYGIHVVSPGRHPSGSSMAAHDHDESEGRLAQLTEQDFDRVR
jgi:hypothetical protein